MAANRASSRGAAVLAAIVAGTACVGHVTNVGSQVSTTTGGTTTTGGLAPGSPCTSDAACASNICGVGGFGNCCSSACVSGDPICGATACDAVGKCSFAPATTACGSCSDGELTPGTCDGLGTCGSGGVPKPCPGNLACSSDGTACNTACVLATDCQSGFYCAAGVCVAKLALGLCNENAECQSGICGLSGIGHCCTAACSNTATPCGATDCDGATGACAFPDSTVACGPDAGCTGDIQTKPGACDGTGNCAPNTVECSPYACGPEACLTTCDDSAQCATGFFCDVANAVCCSGLVSGGTLKVNTDDGSDSVACCGVGTNKACQTLTQAMKLIDSAQARDVTIAAARNTLAPWSRTKETYPIVLGWGVELSAPGIPFDGPIGMLYPHVFEIARYSAQDTVGYASIAGSPVFPVSIGLGIEDYPASTIEVASGSTLYLANAQLGNLAGKGTALSVLDGATLVLGQDQPAANSGTVTIGTTEQTMLGWLGISCQGCTIRDAPLKGQSSIVILGQAFADIQAGDDSTISLTSAPVIGVAPAATTFNVCPSKLDGFASVEEGLGVRISAVLLAGSVNMTYDNGAVQCISGGGFDLSASAKGTPTLELTNTVIQNTELGIFASAGTATLSNSTIQFNVDGVEQSTDGTHVGTIDLGASPDGGANTIVCSSNVESIHGAGGLPGVSVLNTTNAALNASHVAWDTSRPDLFGCDSTLASCSCHPVSCTVSPGADGMDAVDSSGGTITTTGNSLSPISCAPQCGATCTDLQCCGAPPAVYCVNPGTPCVR